MSHGETVSIVLIEDDDGHATLVERNLRRAGISNGFVRFRDGQLALDYFFGPAPVDAAASPYPPREDLTNFVVLLDLKMPRVDGFEVLRRLKDSPQTAAVPVIVLTTDQTIRAKSRAAMNSVATSISPSRSNTTRSSKRCAALAFSCRWSNCRRDTG